MSTRRSTRAASQANSRGATPAIGVSDIPSTPAPRRTARRAGNAPLPAVATRPSTAYGTNTLPAPARTSGPLVSEQIGDVLRTLLDPNQQASSPPERLPSNPTPVHSPAAPKGSASRSRSQTPAANSSAQKSFIDESNIFGDCGVDSSVINSDDSPYLPDAVEERLKADRAHMESVAKQRLSAAHIARGNKLPNLQANVRSAVQKARSWSSTACPYAFWALLPILCLIVPVCLCNAVYGSTQNPFSGYIPFGNQSQFLPGELHSIHQRLNALEHEVKVIKLHFTDFDRHSVEKLHQLLPDHLIAKRDKSGNVLLSDDFWHALMDKLRSEDALTPGGEVWDKYTKNNKASIDTYSLKHLSSIFPKLLRDNHIATKQEIIDSIQNIWNEHKDDISKDMEGLKKKLDTASDNIKKFKHGSGHSKKELAAEVENIVRRIVPQAQLEALSQSKLGSTNPGLVHVNHISKGTGAAINIQLTSPTYIFPQFNVYWWTKLRKRVQHNPIPVPNAPEVALMPWQEHGDCWCGPSGNSETSPPLSLAVIMGSSIYPKQVVVEHILPAASLEPGSTPKDMELLAYIPDPEQLKELAPMSERLFPESSTHEIPDGYIRVAEWTYDAHSKHFVQSFNVGLDMKSVGADTTKVIVRAKSNWGGDQVPYTCLYRVRIHGEIAPPPSAL